MNWKSGVGKSLLNLTEGRPPWEVVNWKLHADVSTVCSPVDLLERSWIESKLCLVSRRVYNVDLLERSWIERLSWYDLSLTGVQSTSLRGRELKDICCRFTHYLFPRRPPWEVVNWKNTGTLTLNTSDRRPPWEVVNWKIAGSSPSATLEVDLLERSWIERFPMIRSTSEEKVKYYS